MPLPNPQLVERIARMYCSFVDLDPDVTVEVEDEAGNKQILSNWMLVAADVPDRLAWYNAIETVKRQVIAEKAPRIVTQ
jgi:nitrogen fixation protein